MYSHRDRSSELTWLGCILWLGHDLTIFHPQNARRVWICLHVIAFGWMDGWIHRFLLWIAFLFLLLLSSSARFQKVDHLFRFIEGNKKIGTQWHANKSKPVEPLWLFCGLSQWSYVGRNSPDMHHHFHDQHKFSTVAFPFLQTQSIPGRARTRKKALTLAESHMLFGTNPLKPYPPSLKNRSHVPSLRILGYVPFVSVDRVFITARPTPPKNERTGLRAIL